MQLPATQTAASLLLTSRTLPRFTSTCGALDSLLTPKLHSLPLSTGHDTPAAKGLGRGTVLELMGPPGVGKTRVSMGFVLGERFREDGGEVLVVDAEGSLSPTLLKDTFEAYAEHHGYDADYVKRAFNGTRYRRIDSTWMMVAFFNNLETWLSEYPKVNLIIFDSLTAHFRPHLDIATRNLLAETLRSSLASICSSGLVSIIITTSLSLKLFGPDHRPSNWSRDAEALLVPQIGERWLPEAAGGAGTAAWRVLLYYDEKGERLARLVSSPVPAEATAVEFTMDLLGPCDLYDEPANEKNRDGEETAAEAGEGEDEEMDLTPVPT